MKDAVLIKGNKYGLTIIMNDQLEFSEINKALFDKLDGSRKFFGSSKITLTFEGKYLTPEEQKILVEVVETASDLDIICIVEPETTTSTVEALPKKDLIPIVSKPVRKSISAKEAVTPVIKADKIQPLENTAEIHQGTLRSGQEVISECSVVIMGNVHFGAKVSAKGNVIIIGKLNGAVHAGSGGDEKAFIVALNMSPTQLRIADTFGRSPDKKSMKIIITPQIAFLEDEHIIIENINRNTYDGLNLTNYK